MTTYTDIPYADSVLDSPCWVSSTDEEKQTALDMGALWIEDKYICQLTEQVQYANALLADMYVNSILFLPQSAEVASTKVKAGSVETETDFFESGLSNSQFSEVNLLLNGSCSVNSSSGFRVVRA